jgi:hypothetical protein
MMAAKQQQCQERTDEEMEGGQGNLAPFSAEERERLARLRRQVRAGSRSDAYPLDKRQDFVRWLIDHGKLSDN